MAKKKEVPVRRSKPPRGFEGEQIDLAELQRQQDEKLRKGQAGEALKQSFFNWIKRK